MMHRFIADLHVHTVLSPCAADEMTPANIIGMAVLSGIDIIAITDHNACENVGAVIDAAKNTNITVIPGMEVETKEEIHVVVLFDTLEQLHDWEAFIQPYRSDLLNDERKFGMQAIVNADGEVIGCKPDMLLAPLACPLADVVAGAKKLGGICIASHIDRPAYSVVSQLGFIPAEIEFDAVEVSRRVKCSEALQLIPSIQGTTVITASDAHTLADLINGPRTELELEAPSVSEIRKALHQEDLRKVVL